MIPGKSKEKEAFKRVFDMEARKRATSRVMQLVQSTDEEDLIVTHNVLTNLVAAWGRHLGFEKSVIAAQIESAMNEWDRKSGNEPEAVVVIPRGEAARAVN